MMLEKLEEIERRYRELEQKLADSSLKDLKKAFTGLDRGHGDMLEVNPFGLTFFDI